MVHKTTF
ncbi:UNVERIFIED_CONTAM: hypothetical protein GTU68_027290 [Idotea baltica]|nr:hypothetical protein [Idotea baltica]